LKLIAVFDEITDIKITIISSHQCVVCRYDTVSKVTTEWNEV